MVNYPRKIRARKRRGKWVFEELVPSAGGSYYILRRAQTDTDDLTVAVNSEKWLPQLLAPEAETPEPG